RHGRARRAAHVGLGRLGGAGLRARGAPVPAAPDGRARPSRLERADLHGPPADAAARPRRPRRDAHALVPRRRPRAVRGAGPRDARRLIRTVGSPRSACLPAHEQTYGSVPSAPPRTLHVSYRFERGLLPPCPLLPPTRRPRRLATPRSPA